MFEMFKIDEGSEQRIGMASTLEGARAQIFALAEFWPAEYAVLDLQTGKWSSFPAYRAGDRLDFPGGSLPRFHEPLLKQEAAP